MKDLLALFQPSLVRGLGVSLIALFESRQLGLPSGLDGLEQKRLEMGLRPKISPMPDTTLKRQRHRPA